MSKPLRVLLIEDSESDAALIVRLLEKADYAVSSLRVESAGEMQAALAGQVWDVVIADYHLPRFDAPAALKVLRETGQDIPFLVVSGTVGEMLAVEIMKSGAHDYLMKDSLARLAPAVEREIGDALTRRERRQAVEALRESEERYRRVVEGAPEGIFVQIGGCFQYLNPAALALFGAIEPGELVGQSVLDRIHPDDRTAVAERIRLLREERHAVPLLEERYLRLDGAVLEVEVTAVPFTYEGSDGAVVFFRDISQRKAAERERASLEDQLRQAQKLESIGRLAGGIAHDFNNLLTVINGYGDLALTQLSEGDPLRRPVDEIRKAGDRAADLTRRLLAFSRKQVSEPRPVDLNRVIGEIREMLRRLLGADIELVTDLASGLGKVMADPAQIHQILMNLAVNARDAMPGGGKLTIETADTELDQSYAANHPDVAPGPFVMLSVGDTGTGISDEIRQHIFEPFFTTKAEGQGTGLGLATVYGIVRQCGGSVSVHSEPGRGARFTLFLPRIDFPAAEGSAETTPIRSTMGSETVLLVEDQQAVRELAAEILKSGGYRVMAAASGGDALLLAERHPGPIHLLLTDVVMPHLTGMEVAERLRALHPETKVLYMSGYSADVINHRGIPDPAVAHIGKPFAPEALKAKVREMLGPARPAGTILVADDEDGVRSLFKEVLAGAGYDVFLARTGRQALKMVRDRKFDAVLVDLVMSEQEGLETIQALRKEHADLKIIAVSGAFRGAFLKTAQELGANASLLKPVSPAQLLTAVDKLLS